MTLSSKNAPDAEGPAASKGHESVDMWRLVDYVLANHLIGGQPEDVPLDRSLVEAGVLDSYDIIELVDFIERSWNITIRDEELTKDNMGSIYRMAAFIKKKGGHWNSDTA